MLNTDLHRLHRSENSDGGCVCAMVDERRGKQWIMLLGLVVAIFLILLVLGVAAPRVAQELRREREVETIHRGNQYVRAIQMYYKKVGTYPGSMEQLEKTNNMRFLRKRYVDPMTGKVDWRVIHVGEAKTTVKGFFGKPLSGLATTGLGSAAGMTSPGGVGTGAGGAPSAFGTSSTFGTPSSGTGVGSSLGGLSGGLGTGSDGGTASSSGGIGGQSGTGSTGSGGPFLGVGLTKDGNSITVLNEQTTYATWEFLYDPRIEQMKAKSSLFGGGPASTSATGLGSGSSSSSNLNSFGGSSTSTPTSTPTPTPTPTPITNTPQ